MNSSNKDDNKKKSNLLEIRDILKNELNKFSNISTTLKDTSEGLNNIDSKYIEYGREINESKTHIIKLKRREFFENLFIYIALIFYTSCVIYITLKRFPVHRIILVIYNICEYILCFSSELYMRISLNISGFSANLTNLNNENYNRSVLTEDLKNNFIVGNQTINKIIEVIVENVTGSIIKPSLGKFADVKLNNSFYFNVINNKTEF